MGDFDLDKFAKAVAVAETSNCTKGIGPKYNNCFGIKDGNTAPCPKVGSSRFCIYEKPEDSFEAFKTIWSKWYGEWPSRSKVEKWTGKDRVDNWLKIVTNEYYK